jgi:hypothetical protein
MLALNVPFSPEMRHGARSIFHPEAIIPVVVRNVLQAWKADRAAGYRNVGGKHAVWIWRKTSLRGRFDALPD